MKRNRERETEIKQMFYKKISLNISKLMFFFYFVSFPDAIIGLFRINSPNTNGKPYTTCMWINDLDYIYN